MLPAFCDVRAMRSQQHSLVDQRATLACIIMIFHFSPLLAIRLMPQGVSCHPIQSVKSKLHQIPHPDHVSKRHTHSRSNQKHHASSNLQFPRRQKLLHRRHCRASSHESSHCQNHQNHQPPPKRRDNRNNRRRKNQRRRKLPHHLRIQVRLQVFIRVLPFALLPWARHNQIFLLQKSSLPLPNPLLPHLPQKIPIRPDLLLPRLPPHHLRVREPFHRLLILLQLQKSPPQQRRATVMDFTPMIKIRPSTRRSLMMLRLLCANFI